MKALRLIGEDRTFGVASECCTYDLEFWHQDCAFVPALTSTQGRTSAFPRR